MGLRSYKKIADPHFHPQSLALEATLSLHPHHLSLHCSSEESLTYLSTFISHFSHCTLGQNPAACFCDLLPLLSGPTEDYFAALPCDYCSCDSSSQRNVSRDDMHHFLAWPVKPLTHGAVCSFSFLQL